MTGPGNTDIMNIQVPGPCSAAAGAGIQAFQDQADGKERLS